MPDPFTDEISALPETFAKFLVEEPPSPAFRDSKLPEISVLGQFSFSVKGDVVLPHPVILLLRNLGQLLHVFPLTDGIIKQNQFFEFFGDLEALFRNIDESMRDGASPETSLQVLDDVVGLHDFPELNGIVELENWIFHELDSDFRVPVLSKVARTWRSLFAKIKLYLQTIATTDLSWLHWTALIPLGGPPPSYSSELKERHCWAFGPALLFITATWWLWRFEMTNSAETSLLEMSYMQRKSSDKIMICCWMSPSREMIEIVCPPFSRAASLFLDRKMTEDIPGRPFLLGERADCNYVVGEVKSSAMPGAVAIAAIGQPVEGVSFKPVINVPELIHGGTEIRWNKETVGWVGNNRPKSIGVPPVRVDTRSFGKIPYSDSPIFAIGKKPVLVCVEYDGGDIIEVPSESVNFPRLGFIISPELNGSVHKLTEHVVCSKHIDVSWHCVGSGHREGRHGVGRVASFDRFFPQAGEIPDSNRLVHASGSQKILGKETLSVFVVPDFDSVVVSPGDEYGLAFVKTNSSDRAFMLFKGVQQTSNSIVPELNYSIVQTYKNPGQLWVEGDSLYPGTLAFTLNYH
ncbi:hypothetical protein HWI79_3584 [Cryptosporidium felis]|nr:hypothetical protein HWI79_3584 [Cryptosporidium felis]